jgi:integrase
LVPLVGEALWAAENAMQTSGPFLFPVFQSKTPGKPFNANTASAALNKWQRENGLARGDQTIHSFRHTMRDRLRDVETPTDVNDRIGGWETKGVGESYGRGHGLEVLQKYLLKVVKPRPESVASTLEENE